MAGRLTLKRRAPFSVANRVFSESSNPFWRLPPARLDLSRRTTFGPADANRGRARSKTRLRPNSENLAVAAGDWRIVLPIRIWRGRENAIAAPTPANLPCRKARRTSGSGGSTIRPTEATGRGCWSTRLWPRGCRKETAKLTLWLKDIAPSPRLRQWFGHDPARFEGFSQRYRAELEANEAAVSCIGDLLRQGPVTLLYAAHDEEHNQARVLADYLRERMAEERLGRASAGGQPRRAGSGG